MDRVEVVERWLVEVGFGLPVLFERLSCGHVVLDPGVHAFRRLCHVCNSPWNVARPGTVHLDAGRKGHRSLCGRGRRFSRNRIEVTCVRCLRMWSRDWVRGKLLLAVSQLRIVPQAWRGRGMRQR